jgi:glutamate/aspartate transport system substrate-binding protein
MNIRNIPLAVACMAVIALPDNAAVAAAAEDDLPLASDAAQSASAPLEPIESLERIKKTGVINISYRLANVPFSYLDYSFRPTGYAKELCERVAEIIKQRLNLPALKIVYLPVKSRDRILLLQNGTIDMECGSTPSTPETRKIADFSLSYFVSNVRFLTRTDYHFRSLDNLGNKTIVVTTNSATDETIREKLDVTRHNITVLQGKTHSDSFLMVKSGRAAAFATDDVSLSNLIANASDPNAYEIFGPVLVSEHYAIMMRKDDSGLKKLVNRALIQIMSSGEASRLYTRWFMNPIPPSGINLNLPMSAELSRIFANPEAHSQ